MSVKLLILT